MDKDQPAARAAHGTTTIAPGVLVTIAKMTALSVRGVTGVAQVPGGVDRWFRRGAGEGVQIEVDDNAVSVDLYLVLANDAQVRQVCRKVQTEVARAIQEMVGMQVNRINVHVEDISF
jgi:uncharacterized alkaline shock family protein YloU